MANEPQTLEQMTKNVTGDAVTTANHNLNNLVDILDKKLASEAIHTQGAALQILQTKFQHRQQTTQMAIEEHKYAAQVKMQADQAKTLAEAAPKLERPQ